jgi:sulfatase modifying factor 1
MAVCGARLRRLTPTLVLLACAAALLGNIPRRRRCPAGSVLVDRAFCIDVFEASLVEVLPRNRTRAWSPYATPAVGGRYRAVSRRGGVPQGYVSQVQARAACAAAGKRLCREAEWVRACKGPAPTPWPYGPRHVPGRCNDGRVGPVPRLFGPGNVFHAAQMNDPRVNQLPGTLARSGSHRRCTNRFGVFDMVGNLHEWVEATTRSGRGVFRGGYYVDVHINGEGCDYATRAHNPGYHDYSIGFRCCADPR